MQSSNPSRILITTGATNEPIDSVRYVGNKSSGKLGVLLGLAGATNRYDVTLLLGPNCVTPTSHPRLSTIPFSSARDLSAKLKELWPSHQILIMAAAVADFTPKGGQVGRKIRRSESLTVAWSPTEDIVAGLASNARADQSVIGFALVASGKLEEVALEKMQRKNIDAIVANPLDTMESNTITAQIYCKDGRKLLPPNNLSKSHFATWLIEHLDEILNTT